MAKCVECEKDYPDKGEPYMCAECAFDTNPMPRCWDLEDPDPENDETDETPCLCHQCEEEIAEEKKLN